MIVALLATLHPKRSGPPPSNNAQLDALLNKCFLREEYRKEIHRLHNAEKSSNPYEAECQNWIGLLLGCYTEEISIADGDQLEAAIMKALGDVHVARGETTNMGSVPPDNFTSVAMWHYCPKDKAQQKYFTEEDAKTHNRTHREQACLHAYNVTLPKSVAGENKVTPRDGYNSVSHNIDYRTHCFNIETNAPNRAKLCEDECGRVCVVFGVQRVTLDLPGVFQEIYAAIKYRHLHKEPLPIAAFTCQFVKIHDVPKTGVILDKKSSLFHIMFRFLHGENLVNITFLKRYSYDDLVSFGEWFVEWLRKTNPYIDLPDDAVSTWFVRRAFDGKKSLTPEEREEYDKLRIAICQKGAAARWLPVIRPKLSKEDCKDLLRDGFTCQDFKPEEHERLCDLMRGLTAARWLPVIRPVLSKDERNDLIRRGFTCEDFTPEEHERLCEFMCGLSAARLRYLIRPELSDDEFVELLEKEGGVALLNELWMKRYHMIMNLMTTKRRTVIVMCPGITKTTTQNL